MKRNTNRIPSIIALAFIWLGLSAFLSCDSHDSENPVDAWLQCQMLGTCTYTNARFGMIGDSWTDFGFGTQLQRDLYDWLVEEHGYHINASNLAGQTLQAEVHQFLAWRKIIDHSGSQLQYMLISLGGNDLLDNSTEYTSANAATIVQQRLQQYELNLTNLILVANIYKMELYGGEPLKWFIHGYDYPNPELVSGCTFSNIPANEKPALMASLLNEFNARQKHLASINPDLYYFDLRGTLGGTQTSNQALKFDCIHPNDIGFQMIAARYAANLQLVTQER